MNSYIVTITSKNQITLPANIVRKLNLSQGQKLTISQSAKGLSLQPKPGLRAVLQPLHVQFATKHTGQVAPTDDELRQFARGVAAKRAVR